MMHVAENALVYGIIHGALTTLVLATGWLPVPAQWATLGAFWAWTVAFVIYRARGPM